MEKIPLYVDTETYSEVNLKTCGTYAYAEKAEVIMFQYAIGDGEVEIISDVTKRLPKIRQLLEDFRYEIVIQNSAFDRNVIKYALGIDIPVERIFDTQVCALAHSLPGSLGELGERIGVDADKQKDKDGRKWINLFCIPRKDKAGNILPRATRFTHPQEWAQFEHYGKYDIVAVRETYKKLPRWNYRGFERELWALDQKINDRGVYVDIELAQAATEAMAKEKEKLSVEICEKTNGDVSSATRRDKLLEHILQEHGIAIKDLTAATIDSKLADPDIPNEVKELLSIRLNASKNSTSKYRTLIRAVNTDNRLRGLLKFCGASRTGRWSGKLFQPQNLLRGSIHGEELERAIAELKANYHGLL